MKTTMPGCFVASPSLIRGVISSSSFSPKRSGRCVPTMSLITTPDSFQVGKLIGSYGFMNITSYSGSQAGLDIRDMDLFPKVQDVGEGNVKIRLYEGRIVQGSLKGTSVILKVYPGQQVGGLEADMMASNELNAHSFLQSSSSMSMCQNLQILLGGFETRTGEQWLAFRDYGKSSAADYAKVSSEKLSKDKYWNPYEKEQLIKRKRYFVIKLLHGALCGLAYMHDRDRLHQSLGPSSVVLNTVAEREAMYLIPRLQDLAFSVDIRYPNLEEESSEKLSEGLWRRASSAGAFSLMEKRAFGIADDIYEAGLLFAYLAFIPFCEAGIFDSLLLQRLIENTFQLDLQAVREYCVAYDRLSEAVKFLDLGDGSGWELMQAMLIPDFRKRPIAEAVVNHRFMTDSMHFNHIQKKMADTQIVGAAKKVEAQYVEMAVPLYSYGCERKMKKALIQLKGIYSVNVNFDEQKVSVWGICNKYDILSTIKKKRKEARFWNDGDHPEEEEQNIITATCDDIKRMINASINQGETLETIIPKKLLAAKIMA